MQGNSCDLSKHGQVTSDKSFSACARKSSQLVEERQEIRFQGSASSLHLSAAQSVKSLSNYRPVLTGLCNSRESRNRLLEVTPPPLLLLSSAWTRTAVRKIKESSMCFLWPSNKVLLWFVSVKCPSLAYAGCHICGKANWFLEPPAPNLIRPHIGISG